MSDQDTKPVEGIKTPVENTEVVTAESGIDAAGTVAVKDEDVSTVAVKDEDVSTVAIKNEDESTTTVKDEDKSMADAGVPKETKETSVAEQGATKTTNGDQGTAEKDVNAEVGESESIATTPTDDTSGIEPMLKVKRGVPQEKSDPSLLPESDDHTLIRRQVKL